MIITRSEIEAARKDAESMRTVINWWQWNDPNGEWDGAIQYLDGDYESCDSWDAMAVADEICDRTIEYITVDCGDVLPD